MSAYVPLLNLSESASAQLHEYFAAWDPLRVCCGTQASGSWKRYLLSYNGSSAKLPSHDHKCATVDLGAAERALTRSQIVVGGTHRHKACTGRSCTDFVADMKRLVLPPNQVERVLKETAGHRLRHALAKQGLHSEFCT